MRVRKIITLLFLIQFPLFAAFADCNFFVKWAMQVKWEEKQFLGDPQNDFTPLSKESGCYRRYKYGNIYATSKIGAWEIHGSIKNKWGSLGWENGFLGYPLSDEETTPDGIGRYNHFQGGSIYWTPATGAHEVHGLIRSKWSSMGWERSYLGYPESDERTTPDGAGRYSRFQGGSIYYHPTHGTHPVPADILSEWASEGYEQGSYGYPTQDPVCDSYNYCTQKFQFGTISNRPDSGVEYCEKPFIFSPMKCTTVVKDTTIAENAKLRSVKVRKGWDAYICKTSNFTNGKCKNFNAKYVERNVSYNSLNSYGFIGEELYLIVQPATMEKAVEFYTHNRNVSKSYGFAYLNSTRYNYQGSFQERRTIFMKTGETLSSHKKKFFNYGTTTAYWRENPYSGKHQYVKEKLGDMKVTFDMTNLTIGGRPWHSVKGISSSKVPTIAMYIANDTAMNHFEP